MLIRANKKVPTIITIETIAATIKNSLSTPLKSPELDIDVAADLLVPGADLMVGLPVVGLSAVGLVVAALLVVPRLV